MITASLTSTATEALLQWQGRRLMPTRLGTARLRELGREVTEQAIFSARVTKAEFLAEIADTVEALLSGEINIATGRLRLFRKLMELGYDPAVGFPDEVGMLPPAKRGSLQDLSSMRRITLILETNERLAANYGRMVEGNTPEARHAYPAWELVRLYLRLVPRGSIESHSPGWEERWEAAGDLVDWQGALRSPWIALKDSPIWDALGGGAGGYQDTLGNPYPPFAFNSGMAWRAVDRERCLDLGLLEADQVPGEMQGTLAPDEAKTNEIFDRMPADLQAELRRELADDTDRRRLRQSEEDFARRERRAAEDRLARMPEIREAHRKAMEVLAA